MDQTPTNHGHMPWTSNALYLLGSHGGRPPIVWQEDYGFETLSKTSRIGKFQARCRLVGSTRRAIFMLVFTCFFASYDELHPQHVRDVALHLAPLHHVQPHRVEPRRPQRYVPLWTLRHPTMLTDRQRAEYRKKTITLFFSGNARYGCYFLTVLIFWFGIVRDHL